MNDIKNINLGGYPFAIDLHQAISIMGTPEDFGATSSFESDDYDDIPKSEWVFGRKLMRDPEDKIIGGVCAGLAAYLGMKDPVWVRLAMAVLVFGMGFSVMLYIILMLVMPEATTASDRLAMRGEDINIENIGNEMERGFESFSDSMNRFGEKMNKFGEKMAGRK